MDSRPAVSLAHDRSLALGATPDDTGSVSGTVAEDHDARPPDTGPAPAAAREIPQAWALRSSAPSERCAACERTPPELYQARRFVHRRWEDVAGLVLCGRCFHERSNRGVDSDSSRWQHG